MNKNRLSKVIFSVFMLIISLFAWYVWRSTAEFQITSPQQAIINSATFKRNGEEIFSVHNEINVNKLEKPFLGFSGFFAKGDIDAEINYSISDEKFTSICTIKIRSKHCFGEIYLLGSKIKCTDCSSL